MKNKTYTERILELFSKQALLRPKDLDKFGIPRRYLSYMLQKGILERISRGVYRLTNADVTENYTLTLISKKLPRGVVCLLSALRFHNLTTQQSPEVWIAVERNHNPSFRMDDLPLHIVRMSGTAFSDGIEHHQVDGTSVRVYSIAKTIADCFKFRNRIGLDVAIESLRESRREKRCSNAEIWHFSKICRVSRVIRPYLEAVS